MFNAYVLILWLFLFAGVAMMLWGWKIIAAGRRTSRWPQVDGVIDESVVASEEDDLLPQIVFSYTVNGQPYRQQLQFPSDITPTQEFSIMYVKRYPLGAQVQVFYNPEKNEEALLEPGMRPGDWMIFCLGAVATVVASLSLLFGS